MDCEKTPLNVETAPAQCLFVAAPAQYHRILGWKFFFFFWLELWLCNVVHSILCNFATLWNCNVVCTKGNRASKRKMSKVEKVVVKNTFFLEIVQCRPLHVPYFFVTQANVNS
jgi:hypothetical protein